ncbi:hypothetical protein FQR65_LT06820 [Abscondita terminalis]|nr:hypothetical protein FQR65_LT06820 [Abscondita terminalis]
MLNIFIVFILRVTVTITLKPAVIKEDTLKNCVARTIANIFNEDSSLLFISEVGGEYAFPDVITNPYIIQSTDGMKNPQKIEMIFSNDENLILHFGKQLDFLKTYVKLQNLMTKQQKNTVLYVTFFDNPNTIQRTFEFLWGFYFMNVVVIGYKNNGKPTVFYSDQYAIPNICGQKFQYFEIGDCNSKSKYQFPNVFRRYPNCNLLNENPPNMDTPTNFITEFFIETIAVKLNMSVLEDENTDESRSTVHVRSFLLKNTLEIGLFTLPFYYDDAVWIVPSPKRLPPLAVLKIVFKPLLWVFIVLAFVLTSIAWWLIITFFKVDTTNNLLNIILNLYSITLLGFTRDRPTSWVLRYLFISYIIYAMHIQTAFNSNLVQVLTIDHYEPSIKTLQNLADSNVPIILFDDLYKWISGIDTTNTLHKAIYNKMINLTTKTVWNKILDEGLTNYTSFWTGIMFNWFKRTNNRTFTYFIDNSFSGTMQISFSGHSTANLWPVFSKAVTFLIEAGYAEECNKKFKEYEKKYEYNLDLLNFKNEVKIVITMEHVCSIFVFWCLGLCLSAVVFVAERAIYCGFCHFKPDRRKMLVCLISFVLCFPNTEAFKLMLNSEMALQTCVANTIESIFGEHNSILLISEIGIVNAFPDKIKNPHVILNKEGLKHAERIDKIFSNDENVVLHFVKKIELLITVVELKQLFNRPQKNTFLYITFFNDIKDIKLIFEYLWKFKFLNLVLIGYDNYTKPTLFYSDQFAIANKCGQKFEQFVIGDCNSKNKHRFPNVFRKHSSCNLFDSQHKVMDVPVNVISRFLLKTIATKLNMSHSKDDNIGSVGSSLYVFPYLFEKAYIAYGTFTIPFYYDDMIWLVPPPKQIPPLAALKLVFKPSLWVFIVLAFVFTSVIWWLLGKFLEPETYNNIFLKVYSITLLGYTKPAPFRWALRYIFISYVIYAIHIQTAFTSNLVQILTMNQYEPAIKSLESLADSDLPILIFEDMYRWVSNIDTKTSLHKTIFNKMINCSTAYVYDKVTDEGLTNYSSFWTRTMFDWYKRLQNKTHTYFVNNLFSGTMRMSFTGEPTINLWPVFNKALAYLIEAGIVEERIKKFKQYEEESEYRLGLVNLVNEDKIVITVQHVSSVFALWGLGLGFAIVVFLAEFMIK